MHQDRAPVLLLELPHAQAVAAAILQDRGVELQASNS